MVKVTSTEFQQRVGHYMNLADQGIEVVIEKLKPKRTYALVPKKTKKLKNNRIQHVLKNLDQYLVDDYEMSDGVAYQRKYRS